MIGCLGDIVFEVNSKKMMTASNVRKSGSASYGEHRLHGRETIIEHTGIDAGKMSLSIKLMKELNADVDGTIEKIEELTESGTPMPLIFGTKPYGKYRWVIKSYTTQYEAYNKKGKLNSATVALNLLEYVDK